MDPQNVPQPGNVPATSFLQTVGAPLVWIGVGYLLATLIQRPRRGPHA